MPRRARISREGIVGAAIGLVGREGMGAFTMARVGRELGVEAMSLYNHFSSKDALLDEIAETLVGEVRLPGEAEGWEDFLRRAARSVRQLAHEHPALFPVVLDRVPNLAAEARLIEAYLRMMRRAGFGGSEAMGAFQALSSFAIGYALSEIRGFAPQPGRAELAPGELPPEEFPGISATAQGFEDIDRDAEFDFCVSLILNGLRATQHEER